MHAGRLDIARELAGNRKDSASPIREQTGRVERAMAFGVLPGDGDWVQVEEVSLPAGRQVIARRGREPVAVAWATAEPVDQPGRVWEQLSAAYHHTGLAAADWRLPTP